MTTNTFHLTAPHIGASVPPAWIENSSSLHELVALALSEQAESIVRREFRRIASTQTGVKGVAHVRCDQDGGWRMESEATGEVEWPAGLDHTRLSKLCETAHGRGVLQVLPGSLIGLNGRAMLTPFRVLGSSPEVMLWWLAEKSQTQSLLFAVEQITTAFRLWLTGEAAKKSDWRMASLAALVELVSKVEGEESLDAAATVAAAELAKYLQAQQVIFGRSLASGVKLIGIGGSSGLDSKSESAKAALETFEESILRDRLAVWPPSAKDNAHQLLAHKQLARLQQASAVVSHPLKLADGTIFGSWLLLGSSIEWAQSERLSRFVAAVSPRISSALDVVARTEPTTFGAAVRKLRKWSSGKRLIFLTTALIGVTVTLHVPVTFRVRCDCELQAAQRRFAVAPYDGLIEKTFVLPGDTVKAGELLGLMDDRQIRWELAGVKAEKEQSQRKREIALAEQQISKALLSELETKRLTTQETLLDDRQQNLEIRSTLDGVVLSGSLERAEAAAVRSGQVLFEIGAMSPMKIEVQIPADELGFVSKGQPVAVRIVGYEQGPLEGTIDRIRPRAEIRNARNVFIADVLVDNSSGQMRPGMTGSVRIDCGKRQLGWVLFHKPWNQIRATFGW